VIADTQGATRGSISGVKLSLSIPADDVEFLDAYAADHELPSRSAAVHHAIRALRTAALPRAYAEAWADFEDDATVWDLTAGDGTP
jgi:Arc/MetJ-type ribon-helix-helix transcriptional regulator